MSDDDRVDLVARGIIERHSASAAPFEREQAEIAAGQGDSFSAEIWFDITAAIDRVQPDQRSKTAT